MEKEQLMKIIEGALFAAEEPLNLNNLQALFDESEQPEKEMMKEALIALQEVYADRGIELKELASGYQFEVRAALAPWVSRLQEEKPPRYSRAFLETLVLIAYRQPITRGEIEEIRGVAVNSHIIRTLMDREWIKEVGFRDVPGHPALLATTKQFLDYFGLKKLSDLPPLSEIKDLDQMGEKLVEQLELTSEAAETTIAGVVQEENIAKEEQEEIDQNSVENEEAISPEAEETDREKKSITELADAFHED